MSLNNCQILATVFVLLKIIHREIVCMWNYQYVRNVMEKARAAFQFYFLLKFLMLRPSVTR